MKIVKENINEKFEEKSDPIKNMGIGGNLYDQYLRVLKKNPKLRIYFKGKEKHHFYEVLNNGRSFKIYYPRFSESFILLQ